MQCRCSVGSERAAASHAWLARAHTYTSEREGLLFLLRPRSVPCLLSPFLLSHLSLVISVSAVYPSLMYTYTPSPSLSLALSLSLSFSLYTCIYMYTHIYSLRWLYLCSCSCLLYPASSLSLVFTYLSSALLSSPPLSGSSQD